MYSIPKTTTTPHPLQGGRMLHARPRIFTLHRDEDMSGISGTGDVAFGVQFPDGTVVIRWTGTYKSTVIWKSIEDVETVHGHGGRTRIVWL